MRVISGILFFVLILFNLAGIPIAFKFHQLRIRREIKNQIKSGIPEEQLHHLSFSSERSGDIQWTQRNREFIYRGDRYDIVFSRKEGSIIHYYCINDREEESLFANLNELVGNKLKNDCQSNKNLTVKLIRALTTLYILNDSLTSITAYHRKLSHFTGFTFSLSSPFYEYNSPPPKFA
jgi:hypothetical protein